MKNNIQLFHSGQEGGFDHYFKSWYQQFCFFALRFTQDHESAEDIVADCFIRVWNKREKFSDEGMLKSYFYVTIANACKRWLQNNARQEKHLSLLKRQADLSVQPHIHHIIHAETIHLLKAAIDTLPQRCREVFIKTYVEEKTPREIATEMNTTVSTVKNQQVRGLKLLRDKVGKNFSSS